MSEKQYLRGTAREVVFRKGGSLINISLNMEQLKELFEGEEWIQIVLTPRREKDKWGNTHVVYKNDFKPEKQQVDDDDDDEPEVSDETDDLPF